MKTIFRVPTYVALLFLFVGNSVCLSQSVSVFNAGQNTSFIDVGFDHVTDEIVLVGNDVVGGSSTPTVYNLSLDQTSFSSSVLTGLGPNTQVTGIAPKGTYISGRSDTSSSDTTSVGVAWQSSAPGAPVSAGQPVFDPYFGSFDDVTPTEAWNGGVVGSLNVPGTVNFAYRWEAATSSDSFVDGPFAFESFASVNDVSGDGTVTVGRIGDAGLETGVIWDESGNTTFFNSAEFASVSANGQFIGGNLGFLDFRAAVWTDGPDGFQPEALTRQNEVTGATEALLGQVDGISDSGFAFGTAGGTSFVWDASFNGIDSQFTGAQDFDDWILAVGDVALPSDAIVTGIIEKDQILHFSVNSESQGALVVSVNTVPEPGSCVISLAAISCILLRRRRT